MQLKTKHILHALLISRISILFLCAKMFYYITASITQSKIFIVFNMCHTIVKIVVPVLQNTQGHY